MEVRLVFLIVFVVSECWASEAQVNRTSVKPSVAELVNRVVNYFRQGAFDGSKLGWKPIRPQVGDGVLERPDSVLESNNIADEHPDEYPSTLRGVQKMIWKCRTSPGGDTLSGMGACLKERVLEIVDEVGSLPEVPMGRYFSLVKDDASLLKENNTAREDASSKDLASALLERAERFLETHSIKVRLSDMGEVEEGRRRHHYKKAFPMMVAGFMMMSAFLVPLGFQFMAMVGGKALLLAKMAFMMSMYHGYKKLYSDIEFHHHHPSHHELFHSWGHRSATEGPLLQPNAMTLAYLRQGNNVVPLKKGK